MKRLHFNRAALAFAMLLVPGLASAFASFGEFDKSEFSPARKERFQIPVRLDTDARVKIELYSADGDRVRAIASTDILERREHVLTWDGRDDNGNLVPDEAYVPVLTAVDAGGTTQVRDPRATSGGEVVENLQVQRTPDRNIAYTLPAPSRVLVRAGIKGGPMMRSLANWEPRGAGKNVQRWDGMDASGVVDLRNEDNLSILVRAFRLPQHAIIATGNTALSYREYRKRRGWPEPVMQPEAMQLTRGDVRIDRQYYMSPAQAGNPRVTLSLAAEQAKAQKQDGKDSPGFSVGQRVRVRVDIDSRDRWLIDRSLYEVAFFVDHQFVSEEEQGYMPLTWLWTLDRLSPGQHVFTVNVSGFDGKVGVVSQRFNIVD